MLTSISFVNVKVTSTALQFFTDIELLFESIFLLPRVRLTIFEHLECLEHPKNRKFINFLKGKYGANGLHLRRKKLDHL